jgi:MFS family permease
MTDRENGDPLAFANTEDRGDASPLDDIGTSTSSSYDKKQQEKRATLTINLISALALVSAFAFFVSAAPFLRIIEDIACRSYYRDHPDPELDPNGHFTIPEEYCKVPAVQTSIATLMGVQGSLNAAVGLSLAIFFGILSDRIGRKPVLLLNIFGQGLASTWTLAVCWFEMPLKLVWLSSIALIIGGGATVTTAIVPSIIADVTSESSRYASGPQGFPR